MPLSNWTEAQRSCIPPPSSRGVNPFGEVFVLSARLPFIRTRRAAKGERTLVQIFVRDNNVDQALKALKKKMQREGSFREMKRHVHFEKPSEKRARQKAEAVRRARKLARKRAQREGLLPAPKPRGR
ncbi:small subunit ribosomal protein S21 [Brevundimonas terrae]|nr:small subunit ribosomal protein S21 [Brevundimonas terrae]